MKIGELVVEPVHDGVMRAPAVAFRGTTEEQWAPHRQFLDADGMLAFALGGFVERAAEIMSGGGSYSGGALLNSLAALGVATGDITDVIFTRLHFDHVGWV